MSELRLASLGLSIICVFMLASCTTTEVQTYNRVVGSRVDEAYLNPDADFSHYTKLYAVPLEIYYAEGLGAPDPEALERMRGIFRKAFLDEIGDDYVIVREPAKDALGVRASLVDLRSSTAYGEVPLKGRLQSMVENGQLTFLMELSDSISGQVLARAADAEKAPPKSEATTESDQAAAVRSAQRWAYIFKSFLDANLGTHR
jgi:hypothetical protein